jgi:large subunit ribosomal protein L15
MRLEDLRPAKGAKSDRKRRGRGNASGQGTTGGRGGKGQTARSGGFHKLGFEGGQTPLHRRLPKFGFTNIFKAEFAVVNLSCINNLPNDKDITPDVLVENGLLRKSQTEQVKILGDGELTKKFTIKAQKFSKSALEKISKAGGKAEVI